MRTITIDHIDTHVSCSISDIHCQNIFQQLSCLRQTFWPLGTRLTHTMTSAGARSRCTFKASVGRSRGAPPPRSKSSSGRLPPLKGGASATMIATRVIRRCQCRRHYCSHWPTTASRGTHAAVAGCATVAAESDDDDDAAGGEADVEVEVLPYL